jgi:orotidine-5'-phosphate decarboxylase
VSTLTTSPICLALDTADETELRKLAEATASSVGVYKIGLTTIHSMGPRLVPALARLKPVFVDAKLHDIPAQVAGAMGVIADAGASYVTVHATGGRDMVRAAVDAAGEVNVLAVTVLTSLDQGSLVSLGISGSVEDAVLRLARVAVDGGAHGLVCSPHEVARVRAEFGAVEEGGPLIVVPGIRPEGSAEGDQKRTMGPKAAIDAGADLIVIGRPITRAEDPAEAAAAILEELNA